MIERAVRGCVTLALATAMTMAPLVAAEAETKEGEWYVGAGLGISEMEPNTNNTDYSIDDERDFGGTVYLGYTLDKRWSVEGYYSDLGEVTLKPKGSIGYGDVGVSALYYLYGNNSTSRRGLSAFVRGGIGRMRNDTNLPYRRDNDLHFMHGAGIEYGLANDVTLRAGLDLYDEDSRLFSVGLRIALNGEEKPVIEPPKDSDGDGVIDAKDQCPGTPQGEVVDASGCVVIKDSDNDGVADPQDQCPGTPQGKEVDASGCAVIKDSDNDGIPDPNDQCPDTAAGEKVDAKGCVLETVIELKGVTFANNSAELVGESDKILDEMAETLKRYPEQRVEIAGYTDNRGSEKYNQQLSERRANAVRDYLIGRGVTADRLTARGFGEADPIADNASAEGRSANRRVELHLLSEE